MTKYLIEVMPDCWRSSHRTAGNWGVYPLNGAERRIVDESELPSDDAEYDCVLRVATAADIAHYGEDEPESICSGIQLEHKACECAQRYANSLGSPVLLYNNEGEEELVEPEPSETEDYEPDSQRTRDADHYLEQWKEDKLCDKDEY